MFLCRIIPGMKNKKPLLFFAFLLSCSAYAAMPAEKRKELEVSCEAKNSKACEAIGTAEMSANPESAGDYFRKACDYGNESSCVFYDSKHPRGQTKIEKTLAPNLDPEMREWMESNMKNLLLTLVSTNGKMDPNHFSLDQCRIPMDKQVALFTRKIASFKHKLKFENGCDAQGTLEIQLGTPFPVDLKVRKLDRVARMQAEAKVDVGLQNGIQLRQDLNLSNGILYDEKQAIIAKFNLSFERNLDFNPMRMSIYTSSNKGKVNITEFRGKPVKEEIPFMLDNLERRKK
jgi:hypothetical protein